MDEMREIVTMDQANALFLGIAVAGPVLGLIIGFIVGGRHGVARSGAMKGFAVGLLGLLNLFLWKVYNGLTDRMGLDTVKNLVVNLALFAGLGLAVGVALGYSGRRRSAPDAPVSGEGVLSPVGPEPGGPAGASRTVDESEEPPRDA